MSSAHNGPRELTDRDLQELLHSELPVVLEGRFDGWATPWRALRAEDWAELGREFGARLVCATIETSTNRATAERYDLESIPQALVLLRGKLVARLHGRVPAREVIRAVRSAQSSERQRVEATSELAALTPEPSPVRSVLRQRAAETTPTLSLAG